MKIFVINFLIFVFSINNISAQSRKYYKFENKELGISFNCPTTWIFIPDTVNGDESKYVVKNKVKSGQFISKDTIESKVYEDCYHGIIFYIDAMNKSLDSTLLSDGFYIKKDGKYYGTFSYMSDRLVDTREIKGNNWIGIHHCNACRIQCKEDNVSPIVEGCEFIYFSNNRKTISISTTWKALDEDVLKIIISSFRIIK